jgi:hypothetical protein
VLVNRQQGVFDTPFEPAGQRAAIDAVFIGAPAQVRATLPRLESPVNGGNYLLATQTAALASVFIYDSGREALPIGGFTGTIPSPTLPQLQADIRRGEFRLVLGTARPDPRLRWIAAHCQTIGLPARHTYFCLPPSAATPGQPGGG